MSQIALKSDGRGELGYLWLDCSLPNGKIRVRVQVTSFPSKLSMNIPGTVKSRYDKDITLWPKHLHWNT